MELLWRTGTGSEIMQRIAMPMIGGMVSSTLLTPCATVFPAIPSDLRCVHGRHLLIGYMLTWEEFP